MKRTVTSYLGLYAILLCLFSCSSQKSLATSTAIDNNFKPSGQTVIPFTIASKKDGYVPLIDVLDAHGKHLSFELDTGCNYSGLFSSGVKKEFDGDEELRDMACSYLKDIEPSLNEKQLRAEAEKLLQSGHLSITLTGLTVAYEKHPAEIFSYYPEKNKKIDKNAIDGIIGLRFFGNCRNIIIDYVHKIIELNGDAISPIALPLHKLEKLNLYETTILINGVPQQGLIDTGAEFLVLRKDYKTEKKYSDEDIFNYTMKGKTGWSIPWIYPINLKIGEISERCNGYRGDNPLLKTTTEGRNLGEICNCIGYSFFKGHRIQFDFEHHVFRVE